ncbi:MAG: PaaI family thioesterase [Hyphomonadaceae bacterium]
MSTPIDLNALIATSPFGRFLNIETRMDQRGLVTFMPVRDDLVGNVMLPALHGGSVAAFLEIACLLELAKETNTTAPARAIDISVEYLRPARREDTFARARVRRLGRRIATVHAEAWQRDENTPVCFLRSQLRLPEAIAGS